MLRKPPSILLAALAMTACTHAVAMSQTQANAVQVPYTETFAESDFSNFTIVDANNDGTTWKYRRNFDDVDAAYIDTQGTSTDDWLFLRPVTLDKSNLYRASFTLHGVSFNYNECAQLYIGTAPDPSSMTVKVAEVVDMFNSRKDPATESGTFSVDESGEYYIGIHASSGYKRYGIFVLGVELSVDRSMATPDAVSELSVIPDMNGACEGKISFTSPTLTVDGNAITAPVDILVRRDGEIIATINDVNPGESREIQDTASEGWHEYAVCARNASGEGVSASATAFFGFDLPSAPASISVKETDTDGKVLVSWTPVTLDVNGKTLPADDVSYKLYGPGGTTVVSKLRDTSYTATATRGEQIFANYGVTAITSKGEGEEFIMSEIIPVGTPYTLPWTETCAGGNFSSIIRYDDFGGYMRFGIYESTETELEDADGSGYYLIGRAYDPDSHSKLFTGKIDLSGAAYPAFTFSYYAIPGTSNRVEVSASDGDNWKVLKTITIDGQEPEWCEAYVDLSEYKGKTIQLALDATVVTHISIALDNFKVSDRPATDLALSGFEGPDEIRVGEPAAFRSTVENKGGAPATGFSVVLLRNGEQIDIKSADSALSPGEKAYFNFTDQLSVTANERNSYHCEVIIDGDSRTDNNKSNTVTASTRQPSYPYINSLQGSIDRDTATLSWDEPDMETMVLEPVTESFETWNDFDIDNGGDWSFIDGDGSRTYYLEDFEFPNQGKNMAAIVLPSSYFSGWNNFDSHSGGKMLASFSAVNGPNDDWIISPVLTGDEQTVSFHAKSMSSVYPDSFEFLYSTSGNDRDSFIQMGEATEAPHDWTEFSYDLPQGAKYFAVRYISSDGFVFMLDDFRFIPESARSLMDELALVGYNVYRDNVRINSTPLEEAVYTDTGVKEGEHTYAVTAVYTQGESRLGNTVTLSSEGSGVSIINPDEDIQPIFYDLQGIRVEQPENGQIYIVVRGDSVRKETFKK